MTTKSLAKSWMREHYPREAGNELRTSKLYPSNLWWLTFPCNFFGRQGLLNILLLKPNGTDFYFLQVPFNYFAENKDRFDIRKDTEEFDLHLSANSGGDWLTDIRERGNRVSFAQFLMETN